MTDPALEAQVGQRVTLTGTLVSTRGPAPEERVHGPAGGYALDDASWAPHES